MSFFFKLNDETQNLLSLEATRHHKSIKLLILLPLRADLLCTLHYETPCRFSKKKEQFVLFAFLLFTANSFVHFWENLRHNQTALVFI